MIGRPPKQPTVSGQHVLDALTRRVEALKYAKTSVDATVMWALRENASLDIVAKTLGITRQAVWQKYTNEGQGYNRKRYEKRTQTNGKVPRI